LPELPGGFSWISTNLGRAIGRVFLPEEDGFARPFHPNQNKEKSMLKNLKEITLFSAVIAVSLNLPALATAAPEPAWRGDIVPIMVANCNACHGASTPEYNDWLQLDNAKRKTVVPL